ncbi:MAG: selenium cofactor biosynthesis protein YqeC [Aggregatilineales bacterium]
MKLYEGLGVARGEVVAFVGAGGKTSALLNLGHELVESGWRVMATTTAHVAAEQLDLVPQVIRTGASMRALSDALRDSRFVFLYDSVRAGLAHGPSMDYITRLLDTIDSDVMLIEADTANGLPLKAPYDHEPYIPPEATLVVPVASLGVLRQDLDEQHVYNARAIVERYGFTAGTRVKSPWVAQVLRDETLGLRGVPEGARVVALLNQVPAQGYLRGRARLIAQLILRSPRVQGVAIGSVRSADPIHEVQRPVGAVVLAAGMSRRMGQPKVLMPWVGRRTIIEHILDQLVLARVDHIVVVTGSYRAEVESRAAALGVPTVFNPDYAEGEMLSSLKAGLAALPPQVAGVLVVLGDQPRIQPRVVNQVMMAYAEGKGGLVVPSYEMKRGHPILIDRRYWAELQALPMDGSLRTLLQAHADEIAYVNVDTDSVLRDVDTPDDYAQERWRAGL